MTFPGLSLVLAMGIGLFSFYVSGTSLIHAESKRMNSSQDVYIIKLPTPVYKGTMSLEETLKKRASVRGFSSHPLKLEELSQLLWALQGTTRDWGGRTAPSAGALFPLEIWVVLKEGVFHYLQRDHQLICIVKQDLRAELAAAALGPLCRGTRLRQGGAGGLRYYCPLRKGIPEIWESSRKICQDRSGACRAEPVASGRISGFGRRSRRGLP